MRKVILLVVLCCVVVIMVTGCGGDKKVSVSDSIENGENIVSSSRIPDFVPIYSGGNIDNSYSDDRSINVKFTIEGNVNTIAKWYESQFKKGGWDIEDYSETDDNVFMNGRKDDWMFSLNILSLWDNVKEVNIDMMR